MRMRRVWPVRLHNVIFSRYLTKGTIFGKNFIEHKMYVLIFLLIMSEASLILRRTERDIVIYVHIFSSKIPSNLVIF